MQARLWTPEMPLERAMTYTAVLHLE